MRRRSLTGELYRAARISNNLRAMSKGPTSYGKRVVRRKVYGRTMGTTGRMLRRAGF